MKRKLASTILAVMLTIIPSKGSSAADTAGAASSTQNAKALNDAGVKAFGAADGLYFSDKKQSIENVVKAEQLLNQALKVAKSNADNCMEATVLRNLASMYGTSTYQGYLEGTVGVAKSAAELSKKTASVKTAWSDPRFQGCKKSAGTRISVYGPALDTTQIDEFENFYQDLRAAVSKGDKKATAALFDFPMNIRGKRKLNVRTKDDFIRMYSSIITPAVARALATTSPADLWGRDQGICVSGGALWLNANMQKPHRFVITSVNM